MVLYGSVLCEKKGYLYAYGKTAPREKNTGVDKLFEEL